MSTYDIQRNPPTAIIKILNREALLYTGNESIAQITVDCKQYLIRKYLDILHVDKVNKKRGSPLGSPMGGVYDPVLVKITIRNTKVIGVMNPDSLPFFKY